MHVDDNWFPNDINKVRRHHIERLCKTRYIGLVVAGPPCDDVSAANRLRWSGLDGSRSRLFWEFHRVMDDIRQVNEAMHPGRCVNSRLSFGCMLSSRIAPSRHWWVIRLF